MDASKHISQKRMHAVVQVRRGAEWAELDDEIFADPRVHLSMGQIESYLQAGETLHMCRTPFCTPVEAVFAFLGGVDNDYGLAPVAANRGLPIDVGASIEEIIAEKSADAGFAFSWVMVSELQNAQYARTIQVQTDVPGPTLSEILGPRYFADLAITGKLDAPENVRLVFWFDES